MSRSRRAEGRHRQRQLPQPSTLEDHGLHVSIVTAPRWLGGAISLQHDAAIVKGALLYADSIHLYSYGAALLLGADSASRNSFDTFAEYLSTLPDEALTGLGFTPPSGLSLTKAQRHRYRHWARRIMGGGHNTDRLEVILAALEPMGTEWKRITSRHAIDIERLAEMGLLVHKADGFNLSGDEARDRDSYAATLEGLLQDLDSRILFDPTMSDVVRRLSGAAEVSVPSQTAKHAREAAVGTQMIGRLPTFPMADLDDILDARATLAEPLANYRTAVMELAAKLPSNAWERASFDSELADAVRSEVLPELKKIRAELSQTRLVSNAVGNTGVQAQSIFGGLASYVTLQLGTLEHLPDAINEASTAMGGDSETLAKAVTTTAGALVAGAMAAYTETRSARAESRTKRFYYLFELQQRLERHR